MCKGGGCRDPHSLPAPQQPFQAAVRQGSQPLPKRVAWSKDLGGIAPVDSEVAALCQEAAFWYQSQGATVEEGCPDLADADSIFQVSY